MVGMAKDGVEPEYLGDGVYVQQDPHTDQQIWLTAENGVSVSDRIAIGPHELRALMRYAQKHGWWLEYA